MHATMIKNAAAMINAVRRVQRKASQMIDTHVSRSEIDEVSAAKITSRKNRKPTICATDPISTKI